MPRNCWHSVIILCLCIAADSVYVVSPNNATFQSHRSVLGHDHVTFRVKASQEARIALSHTHTNVHTGGYSIDIGGGANSVTVIFKGIGDDKVEKAIHQTAGILKPDSFEPFWLSWKSGFIEVSHMTSPHALTKRAACVANVIGTSC